MGLYKIKECLDCGKSFLAHIAKKRCDECLELRQKKDTFPKTCAYDKCKKPFDTTRIKQKFCNRTCRKRHHSDAYYRSKDNG